MKRFTKLSVAVLLLLGLALQAEAGQAPGQQIKVKLTGVRVTPKTFSPGVTKLLIALDFDVRATNAAAGNKQKAKQFFVVVKAVIRDADGNVVRELEGKAEVVFPAGAKGNTIVSATAETSWDGRDANGDLVGNGMYTIGVSGAYVTVNVAGNSSVESTVGTTIPSEIEIEFDATPPKISNLLPENGTLTSNPRPTFSATFSDADSGVNAGSTIITLDGLDITNKATIDADGFTFVPDADLGEGEHVLIVTIFDQAANSAQAQTVLVTDFTPPAITEVEPSEEFLNQNQPLFSAKYSDAGTGIDVATVRASVNGDDVTAQSQVTGAQVKFVPSAALADGAITWDVSVKDKVGNESSASISFVLDTVDPSVLDLSPSVGFATSNQRPVFSAGFSDDRSGVDTDSIEIVLNATDVTAQAQVTAAGFSFTPSEDLDEGFPTLSVTITDRAGNTTTQSTTIEIDLTPSSAPIASSITRGPDRVSFFGETEEDVVDIIATVEGAEIESAVIESWSVVVARTTADQFTLTAQLVDRAGNVSLPTVFTESFEGGEPEIPPPPTVTLIPMGENFTDTDEDGATVFFFDDPAVEFVAEVTSAATIDSVTINGEQAAAPTNAMFTKTLDLPEGRSEITAVAVDEFGQTGSATVIVEVDTTPPEIVINNPAVITTNGLGFLYLGGEGADAARADSDLPRNVFNHETFGVDGELIDENPDLEESDAMEFTIHEIDSLPNDIRFPFVDYATVKSSQIDSILEDPDLRERGPLAISLMLETTPGGDDSVTFDTASIPPPITADLADSDREEMPFGFPIQVRKIYLITFTATDRLGNEGRAHIWAKVDTTAPEVRGVTGHHWTERQVGGAVVGPLTGVVTSGDTVRVKEGGESLLRAWIDGPWKFVQEKQLPTTSPGLGVTVEIEDIAGNTKTETFTAEHSTDGVASVLEVAFYEAICIDEDFGFSFLCGEFTGVVGPVVLPLFGDQPPDEFDERFLNLPVAVSEFNIDGNDFVALPPSWADAPRQHSYTLTGVFPFAGVTSAPLDSVIEDFFSGNFPGVPTPSAGTPTVSSFNAIFTLQADGQRGSLLENQTSTPATSLNESILESQGELDPENNSRLRPGINALSPTYGSGWFFSHFAERGPTEQERESFPENTLIQEEWGARFGIDEEPFFNIPRKLKIFEVTPDVLVAGQRQRVLIRGYFGDNLKAGDAVAVSFASTSASFIPAEQRGVGDINVVDPATGEPAAEGKIIHEDIFNTTAMQTVEVFVEPSVDDPDTPDDEGALGVFDVTVGGTQLEASVNVVLLTALNKDGQPIRLGTAASNVHPIVEIDEVSPGDVVRMSTGIVAIEFTGTVRDAIADVVEGGGADITEIDIDGNKISVTKVQDDRQPDPNRPFPFKGTFEASVLLAFRHGDNPIVVKAVNSAGNAGFASFSVRTKIEFDEDNALPSNTDNSVYLAEQPVFLSLPPVFDPTVADVIGVGLTDPAGGDPLPSISEDAPDSNVFAGTTSLFTETITVGLQITELFNPQAIDRITAEITSTELGLSAAQLEFIETGEDTRVFRLTSKGLRLQVTQFTSETIDILRVAVDDEGQIGSFIDLTETTPTSRSFSGTHPDLGQISVAIPFEGEPDPEVRQEIVATVTANSVQLIKSALIFQETGLDTNEYIQLDLGFAIGGIPLTQGSPAFKAEVLDVVMSPPTSQDIVNPIRVRYKNVLDPDANSITIAGKSFALVDDPSLPGAKVVDRPALFVSGPMTSEFPNVFDVRKPVNQLIEIEIGGVTAQLANILTASSNRTKVPAGVDKVPVVMTNKLFKAFKPFDFTPAQLSRFLTDLRVIGPDRRPDGKIQIDRIKHERGEDIITFFVTVSGDHETIDVVDPQKPKKGLFAIRGTFRVQNPDFIDPRFPGLLVGDNFPIDLNDTYAVTKLKTLVVALDGVSKQAINDAIAKESVWKELFAPKVSIRPTAINSLPTVTFTNWATWVTGLAPEEHGILGNAFFPRDFIGIANKSALAVPFGCANRKGLRTQFLIFGAVLLIHKGEYDDKGNGLAAFYDGLVDRMATGKESEFLHRSDVFESSAIFSSQYLDSAFQATRSSHLTLTYVSIEKQEKLDAIKKRLETRGKVWLGLVAGGRFKALVGHNKSVATRLDERTKRWAVTHWERSRVPADYQFIYFPGPDNVAHDESSKNKNPGSPLDKVVTDHLLDTTGKRLEDILKVIKRRGYEHAVLLVAISDHGMLSTPNAILTEQNVQRRVGDNRPVRDRDKKLAKVYEASKIETTDGFRTVRFWRGGDRERGGNINEHGIVHAPNGGAAHVYVRGVRGGEDTWEVPPDFKVMQDNPDHLLRKLAQATEPGGQLSVNGEKALAPLGARGAGNPRLGLLFRPDAFGNPYAIFDKTAVGGEALPPGLGAGAGGLNWTEVNERLTKETIGIRSGDIMLLMNTNIGAISVTEEDKLPGWHGGPTVHESEVPMYWHYAGESDSKLLAETITGKINGAKGADKLRSRHFKKIVIDVLNQLKEKKLGN